MKKAKSIGGYFELELPVGKEYHQHAIRLNTGRNAFEYILRVKQYKKVYLPYYTCDVMLEPIVKLNLEVQFYSIDMAFRPVFDFSILEEQDVFLYTNYYGICENIVFEVSKKCKNLIIDNAQAFYSKPLSGVDTFYSPRKFFGVSDGGYLYTDLQLNEELDIDISHERFSHHLKRIDISAEEAYSNFILNDKSLDNNPIRIMSFLTSRLLSSIDYEAASRKRKENFLILHKVLAERNSLKLDISNGEVPLVYPFMATKELRLKLLENKIYTATYWPNVSKWCDENSIEYQMMSNLIHLPIDQRYGKKEMKFILKLLK